MEEKWYEEGRDRCTPGTGRGETVKGERWMGEVEGKQGRV